MGPRDRAVLLCLFMGFAILFLEVRYEHRSVVSTVWQAWIPIVYSALGALACLVGLAGKKGARTVAASVFFLGLAVGTYGLYMHTKFDLHIFQQVAQPDAVVPSGKFSSDGRPIPVVVARPVAAPLSMAGLAAVGFVVCSGMFKSKAGAN
ncbi:MAG: hypothetical protein JSS66_18320 [Armatimonadetes bacterium]|nr:hypothetical protein [Armatimonadota bacterium]